MRTRRLEGLALAALVIACLAACAAAGLRAADDPAATALAELESAALRVTIDTRTGRWSLLDRRADVRWPTEGTASAGDAPALAGGFAEAGRPRDGAVVLRAADGSSVAFELADGGESLILRYGGEKLGEVNVLGDLLSVAAAEGGRAIVPCREGLLVPAAGGKKFERTFGTSDYEGCHMNMLGFLKSGAALVVTWDDAYVFPRLAGDPGAGAAGSGAAGSNGEGSSAAGSSGEGSNAAGSSGDGSSAGGSSGGRLSATLSLRRSARSVEIRPLGKGDENAVAAGYRRIAERKGLAATNRARIARNADLELLLGASNFKLWTCLARRRNEESTADESVTVRWTFAEAARIAEHLKDDLGIDRCLFIIGGWTEGGYDCRHPDNLPANPECGGNEALESAIRRIQDLGYIVSLHDNYQDMYRDAKSWSEDFIEKALDGSLIQGGRWLGGRAYMVCAPKQLELAKRPENLPGIRALFPAKSYFIDTTYAVGPRECHDPGHPIGRNEDILWKSRLSDYAREVFGLFGSECGREWALPHSDFFEGLTGVSGKYFHNLDPAELGATVIPFWEMVYHDCQVAYGKYGYSGAKAGEYVAHHVLCARPLHYHSVPDGIYWKSAPPAGEAPGPGSPPEASYARSDGGWAEGMHPLDVFVKNTHEVLGPLNADTAHERLARLELLGPGGTLRRATYGEGDGAVRVVVNFGTEDAEAESRWGGAVVLPPFGFVADGPRLAAFHARRWGGEEYPGGALFALRSLDGEDLAASGRVRVFHGFGPPGIRWKGARREVPREAVLEAR